MINSMMEYLSILFIIVAIFNVVAFFFVTRWYIRNQRKLTDQFIKYLDALDATNRRLKEKLHKLSLTK